MLTAIAAPLLVLASQIGIHFFERAARFRAYDSARAVADRLGKPLLNVGCATNRFWASIPAKTAKNGLLRKVGRATTRFWSHPCGDVCLDISLVSRARCKAEAQCLGDVRNIPYADRSFGAAFCSHVLEHMPTVADAEQALRELHRVADHVYVCSPTRLSIIAWTHPEHQLWIDHWSDGSIHFQQRLRNGHNNHRS